MPQTNINAILKMVKAYLEGKVTMTNFVLDFPYEMEKRYAGM